jgi:predicted metalloprotease with PDZ domain
MRFTRLIAGAMLLAPLAGDLHAQVRARVLTTRDDEDRAVLGITTSNGGRRDTLGLLIGTVTRGGPADKAGLVEGDRIASINGVNLRLSAEDVEERDMDGVPSRRLVREMGKVKAGDEVELKLWSDGRSKTVRVKTVSASDLEEERFGVREDSRNRPVLGLSVGSTGSRRDTLGLMVMRIATDGPAEKAGLQEGDRISAINGVDVRVPREDAEDFGFGSSRMSRFQRELRKVKLGDDVELQIYSGGRTRTVRVRPVKASDLSRDERGFFYFGDGVGSNFVMPPMPPIPPVRINIPRVFQFDTDAEDGVNIHLTPRAQTEIRERARDATERARETLDRVRENSLRLQDEIRAKIQPAVERARYWRIV